MKSMMKKLSSAARGAVASSKKMAPALGGAAAASKKMAAIQGGPANVAAIQGGPANVAAIQGGPANVAPARGGPANVAPARGGLVDAAKAAAMPSRAPLGGLRSSVVQAATKVKAAAKPAIGAPLQKKPVGKALGRGLVGLKKRP